MKNISFYKIALLLAPLFLIFSCAKEKDVTKTTTSNPGPIENTDIYTVQGIVKDTTDQPIGGASLKAYFDDLEIETMSDMGGNYEFKIPKSKTDGYVVASKTNFSKAITAVRDVTQSLKKDIFLVETRSSNTIDISLRIQDLISVTGRIVDENGMPVNQARYTLYQIGAIDGMLKLPILGQNETGEDGTFEILAEKGPFDDNLFRTRHPSKCGSGYFTFWPSDEIEKDLGDIEVTKGNQLSFSTNIDVNNCASPNAAGTAYFIDNFLISVYDHPLGNLSKEYCPDPDMSDIIYLGAENESKTEFNGAIKTLNQLQTDTDLDICTPADHFWELIIGDDTTLITDLIYDAENMFIQSTGNPEGTHLAAFSAGQYLKSGNQIILQGGKVNLGGGFDLNDDPVYKFIEFENSYVNYIENNDNIVSGVVFGKVKMEADGSIKDVKMRFRIIL